MDEKRSQKTQSKTETTSESDSTMVQQQQSYSSNWKALKKTLDNESSKQRDDNNDDSNNNIIDKVNNKNKRKRKRKLNETNAATNGNFNIWKKRRAEIEAASTDQDHSKNSETNRSNEITKAIGLDCEYVGAGMDGNEDVLARVSMVNMNGECIYDKYVKPKQFITDYRSQVSGIRPSSLVNGESFEKVQQEVHKLLADKIVVGHALQNDFRVLNLSHTRKMTRDTSKYMPFRQMANVKKTPSLKLLAKHVLGIDIQMGEHDSIVDARVAMRMYTLHKKKWEADIRRFK